MILGSVALHSVELCTIDLYLWEMTPRALKDGARRSTFYPKRAHRKLIAAENFPDTLSDWHASFYKNRSSHPAIHEFEYKDSQTITFKPRLTLRPASLYFKKWIFGIPDLEKVIHTKRFGRGIQTRLPTVNRDHLEGRNPVNELQAPKGHIISSMIPTQVTI